MNMMKLKRVYEKPEKADGTRILVDRLWPRGLTKAKARVDIWLKDLGPSTELRQWFGHDPKRWKEFRTKYRRELKDKDELLGVIRKEARRGTVTIVYGARDTEHNEALLIMEYLRK